MKITASKGTTEQFLNALDRKITELSGVESSQTVKAATGTTEDFISAVNSKIQELDGSYEDHPIDASVDISDMDPVLAEVIDYFENVLGWDTRRDDVRNYANAVAEYIETTREYDNTGVPYTVDEWYYDTKTNYPEEIAGFESDDIYSCGDVPVDSTEAIMGHDDHNIDWDKLWEISDRYVTDTPLSGDWSTETKHEQEAISNELGVSMEEAKHLMIEHLMFPPEEFDDYNNVAATTSVCCDDICANDDVLKEFGIDADALMDVADRYIVSDPLSGNWDTETVHEQQAIANEFNISLDDAKRVMKEYLGFSDDDFITASEDINSAKDPDMIDMTYSEITAADDIDEELEVDDVYARELQGAIEQAILKEIPDAIVTFDDDGTGEEDEDDYEPITEIYVTVTTPDIDPQGRPSINDYTVPMEDLTGDMDTDTAYVLESIDELKADLEDEETQEDD